MELALFVWFANITQGLSMFLGFIGFILIGLFTVLSVFAYFMSDRDNNKPEILKVRKWKFNLGVMFGLFLMLMSNLIPSERTIYLMVGAYMAQEVVTSNKFKSTSNDVYEIVDLKLKQIKKELQTDVVDNSGEKK